jgi:hypothetical protein
MCEERWASLIIEPDAEAISTLIQAWDWLLPAEVRPLLFTALGDMFYEDATDAVFWLDSGRGEITRVADGATEFYQLLETEEGAYWLLPRLIAEAIAAGKVLSQGECYAFSILPVFAEGEYSADNLLVMPAGKVYAASGEIHRQIHDTL